MIHYFDLSEALTVRNAAIASDNQPEQIRYEDRIKEFFLDILPPENLLTSSSWDIIVMAESIKLRNALKCFDDDGNIEEHLPFQITISPSFDFSISFCGSNSKYIPLSSVTLNVFLGSALRLARARYWSRKLVQEYPGILAEAQALFGKTDMH